MKKEYTKPILRIIGNKNKKVYTTPQLNVIGNK